MPVPDPRARSASSPNPCADALTCPSGPRSPLNHTDRVAPFAVASETCALNRVPRLTIPTNASVPSICAV